MNSAEYARLRALVDLRLDELRAVLNRHEAEGLDDRRALVDIEAGLAALVDRARSEPNPRLPGQASEG